MEELAKIHGMGIVKWDLVEKEFLYEGGDIASQFGYQVCYNAKGEILMDGK